MRSVVPLSEVCHVSSFGSALLELVQLAIGFVDDLAPSIPLEKMAVMALEKVAPVGAKIRPQE